MEISKEVINQSWDRITVKDIKTDKGFERYLKCETARLSAAEIFGADIKNFFVFAIDKSHGVFSFVNHDFTCIIPKHMI